MIQVVIPAHNEAAVIGRCLRVLLGPGIADTAATHGGVRVVVVANGCSDGTASVASEVGASLVQDGVAVEVLDLPVGGKIGALNAGDARLGPPSPHVVRCYVDADVEVRPDALAAVAGAMAEPDILAAAPRMRNDLSQSPAVVRWFFEAWQQTGYHRRGMLGSGFYGISGHGRARFGAFPEIIADDAFARLQFQPGERCLLPHVDFTVHAPRSLWGLIKIKTRSHLGNLELRERFPALVRQERPAQTRLPFSYAARPWHWHRVGAFVAVKLLVRARARRQAAKQVYDLWERDDSARAV